MAPGSEIRRVGDLVVPPRFLDGPEDASGCNPMERKRVATPVDPLAVIESHRVVVVYGDGQMGVTSALLWLLERAYRADQRWMPAYLSARASGLGTMRPERTLAVAAGAFGYRRSFPGAETALHLAIDELDAASDKKRVRTIDFVAEHERDRCLLAAGTERAATLTSQLGAAGVSFGELFLGAFGYRELCALAERIPGAERADVELVASLLRGRELRRTPRTLSMLLAVSASQREPDSRNECDLLDDFAEHLLCVERPSLRPMRLDRKQRLHLMAEIAHVMDEAPTDSMETLEAEERLLECLHGKGLSGPARRIIDQLIERDVLVECDRQLSFREPALQALYLGHWMEEHPDRRAEILADPGHHHAAIRHCARLTRNDKRLLSSVTAHAMEVCSRDLLPTTVQTEELFGRFSWERPWEKERLDAILRLQPASIANAGLDAESDDLATILQRDLLEADSGYAQEVRELGKAVGLLSAVLGDSELVNDVGLKKEAFETAIEGWVRLIGAMIAEDENRSLRNLVFPQLAHLLGEGPRRSDREREVTLMTFALTACRVPLYACLCRSDLTVPITRALDGERLNGSDCACCLATWLYVELELPGWPERLRALLDRLPAGTLLRDATAAVCVQRLRAPCSEPIAEELIAVLEEKGAQRPRHRKRIRADLAFYRGEARTAAATVSA